MKAIIASNLVKFHGGTVKVLSGATLSIERGEKVGLVGKNGAGKTTLMDLLSGATEPDSGTVEYVNNARVGLTSQSLYAREAGRGSIQDEISSAFSHLVEREEELKGLEAQLSENPSAGVIERYGSMQAAFERDGGYTYRARAASALSGLGFAPEEWSRPVGSFSGGEQSRVALAKLLLEEPDLILLDEPTNHLDLRAIEWLEELVKSTRSAVLTVSHDRYFLDNTADAILELDEGKVTRFPGNYTRYVSEKAERDELLAKRAKANAERRQQLERFITKYKAKSSKARQAKSKQKLLDRMGRIEAPGSRDRRMKLDLGNDVVRAGRVVLEMEDARFGYGDGKGGENGSGQPLIENLDLVVERGERVALLGPNGTGKSTIMRLIDGEETPERGSVRLGHNVTLAYQDQQLARLSNEKTLLEEVRDATGLDPADARDLLGAFFFSGNDVFKKVGALSGGERSRLSLAEIVAGEANLLLLDEPTNNLDIPAREALEDALLGYPGTMFFISHDRYFLKKISTRIVELENKRLTNYPGGFDYYRSHVRLDEASNRNGGGRRRPRQRVRPGQSKEQSIIATRLVAVEGEIDATERRVGKLERDLASSELYSDGRRSREVVMEHRELKDALEGLYSDWGELLEEAEQAGL